LAAREREDVLAVLFHAHSIRRLLEPDVDAVEYELPGIDEFHRVRLLPPLEFGGLQIHVLRCPRGFQADASRRYRDEHSARRVEFSALARMQNDARNENARVIDQQSLPRSFRNRTAGPAAPQDFGIDHAIRRAARIADAMRLRLGPIVDEIGLADGALAALNWILAEILRDGRRGGNVHEHAVVAMPVIERLVTRLEFHIEIPHVLVCEYKAMSR